MLEILVCVCVYYVSDETLDESERDHQILLK